MRFKILSLCLYNFIEQDRSLSMSSFENSEYTSTFCSAGTQPENIRHPFVHESIANVLSCNNNNSSFDDFIDEQTWEVNYDPSMEVIDSQALISLAHASDKVIFTDISRFRPSSRGLIKLATTRNVAAATLLALNILESAIRMSTGNANGRAPLLKTMLHEMERADHSLAPILKSLLLPFPGHGLNLRNLLWHGFISDLPRPWFSLVLLLVYNLEKQQDAKLSIYQEENEFFDPKSFNTLNDLIEELSLSTSDIENMSNWLPETSHRDLFQLAITWRNENQYPACAAVLLSVLIEHGLRIRWCRINDRPCDLIAKPGAYFVTLDGHGQRNQHDLLLHPYMGQDDNERKKNLLFEYLGGGRIALLTDLFASSCGGPNIRAALAHGSWQSYIEDDLASMDIDTSSGPKKKKKNMEVWNIVRILLVAFKTVATSEEEASLLSYTPQFSFSASTIRNMKKALDSLEHLETLEMAASQYLSSVASKQSSCQNILALRVPTPFLRDFINRLAITNTNSEQNTWTSCDVFAEYDFNVALSNCAAARALLCETDKFTKSYTKLLRESLDELESDNTIVTRQYRRTIRLVNMIEETLSLYSFSLYVALLFIQAKVNDGTDETVDVNDTLLQAVKRSRMCTSTFSTFLPTNLERSIKAANEFSRGKAIKILIRNTGFFNFNERDN